MSSYGLRDGDILFNRVNSMPFLGKSALVLGLDEPCVFESNMMRFPKHFAVVDEASANWVVKKVVAARDYATRVKVWSEQETARAAREEKTLLFLFGKQIEEWARHEIEKLHKRKSLALPAGGVGFRTIASKLVVDDEGVVLGWAKASRSLLATQR